MQKIVSLIYKGIRRILISIRLFVNYIITWIILYGNNVQFKRFKSNGIPYINIARGGFCTIKNNFKMNNGNLGNPIGRPQRCILNVKKGATLTIGENVGMSSTAHVVHQYISIVNNVKIGSGSCINDKEFWFYWLSEFLVNSFSNQKIKSTFVLSKCIYSGILLVLSEGFLLLKLIGNIKDWLKWAWHC